jgi:hypothetical protein
LRVYINEQPVETADGADALSAVRGFDAELARRVESGAGYITDARAIRLQGNESLSPGDILRVVTTSRRSGDQVDADP